MRRGIWGGGGRGASRQSAPSAGGISASAVMASTMPSSRASLLATWVYSDMPCTPSPERSHAVRQLGAVLEGSRNVYWPLTGWQNLMYFGRLKGLRGHEIKPRAEQLLADLGLWDRRNETVGSYSRGMQQKVAIAAALITDPPIILLDEPTIGLDVEAARTVRDSIAHLAADEGKTTVLTTHQLGLAQELAGPSAAITAA